MSTATEGSAPRWAELHDRLDQRLPITGTIPALLERAADRHGDWTALTDPDGTSLTFRDLAARAARFGSALQARGIGRGDRVAVMLPNTTAYVVAFFGALRAGAVVVQVNPIHVGRELAHMLTTTQASTIVVGAAALHTVRDVRGATSLERVVVAGEVDHLDGDEESFADVVASGDPRGDAVAVDPDADLATIQFTGGTTGRFKGAMLTHTNLLAGLQPTFDLLLPDPDALPPNAAAVAAAPFFHIFGLTMVLLAGVHHGWDLLLVPRPTPDDLVVLVRERQPSYLAGVATLFVALQNHPDADTAGLDRVALYTSGGASVPATLLRAFERRTGRTLFEGYGLSEGAPVSFNTHLRGSVAGSIGIPIPGTHVRIVDTETGQDAAPGRPGELCVQGPQVMQGYFAMPQETEQALADGWLHTGDVATMDEDGYLRIVDRIKDMINASGYKVYPREVEDVVYELDDVVEAAVVGAPDDYRGETVKLAVVTRDGSTLSEDGIVAHCRQHLAAYKVPRIVEFRDELPKSAVGKILRREL